MSVVLGLVIFSSAVLFFCWFLMYFISKRDPPVLKLVWQNKHYQVYELMRTATIATMYESLLFDLDNLCVTDSAREDFCQKHNDKLSVDNCNFFLSKRHSLIKARPDNLFVIIIGFKNNSGYFNSTDNYRHAGFWGPGHRLIIPRHKS